MEYSFTKGLWKGGLSVLVVAASMVAFAGFADLSIWGLLETYLKPVLGSLTVGGAFAMAINYFKVKNKV